MNAEQQKIIDRDWRNLQGKYTKYTVWMNFRAHVPHAYWDFSRHTADIRPITKRKTHVKMVIIDEFPNGFEKYDGFHGGYEFDWQTKAPYSRLFYRYECPEHKADSHLTKGWLYFPYGAIVTCLEKELPR